MSRSQRFRFADFVADLSSGELFKNGSRVQLQDKPFQLLAILLQRPKEVVGRKELISRVWPDTFVEEDLCLNVAIRRLRSALNDNAAQASFIETVGSHGYRFIFDVRRSGASEVVVSDNKGEHPRVAVFPLRAPSDSHCTSFAVAMTELIIVELRRLQPSLCVLTPEYPTEHARKGKLSLCKNVSADYMLVGAVSEAGTQKRIIVRLVRCRAQVCIWADSYMLPKGNLFANQTSICRRIARSVAQSIPISIRPAHLGLATAPAYEAYLQGCSLRSKLSEDALERCIPYFESAVRECPQFALAWAALANAHCTAARLGTAPSAVAFPKIKNYAEKALAIEDLTEARTALAYYHFFYEHEWDAAESSLLRALSLDARYPLAVGGYAQLLAALGRHTEAVFLMRQACELDPFAGYSAIMFGWALYYARNYEASHAQLKRAMELDSSLWVGHTSAGMALERLGEMQTAVAEFRLAMEYSDNSALASAHLAFGLARMGDRAGATKILNALLKLRNDRYFSPYWLAVIYVALNNPTEALTWLENAARERCSWIVFAREDPKLDVLHSDPRFYRAVSGVSPAREIMCPA